MSTKSAQDWSRPPRVEAVSLPEVPSVVTDEMGLKLYHSDLFTASWLPVHTSQTSAKSSIITIIIMLTLILTLIIEVVVVITMRSSLR